MEGELAARHDSLRHMKQGLLLLILDEPLLLLKISIMDISERLGFNLGSEPICGVSS